MGEKKKTGRRGSWAQKQKRNRQRAMEEAVMSLAHVIKCGPSPKRTKKILLVLEIDKDFSNQHFI
jgi:hypothetical protein